MIFIVANKRNIFVINVDFGDQIGIITIAAYEYFFLHQFYFRRVDQFFSFGQRYKLNNHRRKNILYFEYYEK